MKRSTYTNMNINAVQLTIDHFRHKGQLRGCSGSFSSKSTMFSSFSRASVSVVEIFDFSGGTAMSWSDFVANASSCRATSIAGLSIISRSLARKKTQDKVQNLLLCLRKCFVFEPSNCWAARRKVGNITS